MGEDSGVVIPEDILLQLFGISRSSNLNEALEILIQIARTDTGRSDLASKGSVPLILNVIPEISPNSSLLLSCLKLLRNLCAGEIISQDAFIKENGVDVILTILKTRMLSPVLDCGGIRAALQFLANVSLAGDEHRQILWSKFFPEEFLLLARVQHLGILDPLCMIIYICSDGNHEHDVELSREEGLQVVAEIVRTASIVGFQEQWFKLLILKMCFDMSHLPGLFAKLFNISAPDDNGVGGRRFNGFLPEQSYLISILSEILSEQITEISVSGELALFILQLFREALGTVEFSSRGLSGLPTGSPATDVLGYTLVILRDICAQDGVEGFQGGSKDAVDTLLSHGLLDLLLCILQELEPPAVIRKSVEQREDQENMSSRQQKLCPYRGFRRDVVAIIGNCAYGRKNVQDELRCKNGLLLMLQQCVSDEDNPFLREWGIWTMRNLLEGNAENQEAVRELEFQGSVTMPEIANLGLKVEMNLKSGRAKLVNCT